MLAVTWSTGVCDVLFHERSQEPTGEMDVWELQWHSYDQKMVSHVRLGSQDLCCSHQLRRHDWWPWVVVFFMSHWQTNHHDHGGSGFFNSCRWSRLQSDYPDAVHTQHRLLVSRGERSRHGCSGCCSNSSLSWGSCSEKMSARETSDCWQWECINWDSKYQKWNWCWRSHGSGFHYSSPPPRLGKSWLQLCPVCQAECSSGLALDRHLKSLHPLSWCFSCTDCDVVFNNLWEVTSHKANVQRMHKVACKHCNYHTISKTEMRQHIQIHTAGIKCKKCPKRFPSLSSLLVHERLQPRIDLNMIVIPAILPTKQKQHSEFMWLANIREVLYVTVVKRGLTLQCKDFVIRKNVLELSWLESVMTYICYFVSLCCSYFM